ncbi:MFS transporter [Nonomuraea sp. LPB2021202275-12-8]|uniref:MFS transporter n=1 Tax=Nonomuraea sp. LPB2021202275-12-8 TaxID=3120159 RepID=UPI00300D2F80
MRAHLPLRLTRTAAFAAVCVTLAALAHSLGGGTGPDPWAAGVGLAVVFALAMALSGTERSTTTINATLVVTQLGLHELFGGDGSAYVAAHQHGRGLGDALGMLLAHLTATLVTGCWLARGEAALWAMLRRLARRLVLLRPVATAPLPPAAPIAHVRDVPRRLLFRHSVARRGPPLPA